MKKIILIFMLLPLYLFSKTFNSGSYIIDMGVVPQNTANGLKPYGLIYDLTRNHKIPVSWIINTSKSKDATDFTYSGKDYKGGAFVISAEYAPDVLSIINNWKSKGVIIDGPTDTSFDAPLYNDIKSFPNVIIDKENGKIVEDFFYKLAEIPSSSYRVGVPSTLGNCDDFYAIPHADPEKWDNNTTRIFNNYIQAGGNLWAACRAVSAIENKTLGLGFNYLSDEGLQWSDLHTDNSGTFAYTANTSANPIMQFIGILDGALQGGTENIYIPKSSWRATTTVAVSDSSFVLTNGSSGPAGAVVYGKAMGNPDYGTIVYETSHTLSKGSNQENVAAARVFGNYLLLSAIEKELKIEGSNIPDSVASKSSTELNVSSASATDYLWTSSCGGSFSPDATHTTTTFLAPSVDKNTSCTIRVQLSDACKRSTFVIKNIIITPKNSEPFTCNNEGIIFSGSPDANDTSLSIIDLENQALITGSNFGTRHINAIGYNVQDNFIYGIGFKNDLHNTIDVVRIDKNYKEERLNISGLPQGNSLYGLGDVDFNNTYYVSTIQSENSTTLEYLQSLIVINLDTKSVEKTIALDFPTGMTTINAADYAFNPKDSMLYTIDATSNQLIRIHPTTGKVEKLGDIGNIAKLYIVISFFDLDGNFLFTNINNTNHTNNTTIYKIDISNPDNINPLATIYIDNLNLPASGDGAKCAYSKLPYKPFLGAFNIERTNSGNDIINSDKRNAWYTQIVGRDFDYSVLFYNDTLTAERNISSVTMKIELINQETNVTLYERYAYIPINAQTSRVDVTLPTDDLSTLPATKKAIFRVSYGVDVNNSIIQEGCNTDYKSCYDRNSNIKTDYAKDNFSIRPEKFHITLKDKGNPLKSNRVRLAAGYEYNLTIIATQKGIDIAALDYNTSINKILSFIKPSASSNCNNESNITSNTIFQNGENRLKLFEHNNVGSYTLHLIDEDWTKVDWNKTTPDCNVTKSTTSIDGNTLTGCNIESNPNFFLKFYPDHFNVELNLFNLPNSGHPDFIYMMELNSTSNNVAIAFDGNITAKSEDNTTTTNFTAGCVANNIRLDLDTTTVSVEGINQNIHTIKGSNVNFSRVIRFNDETDKTQFYVHNNLSRISKILPISSNKFLNENNGIMSLDMRFNLNKNLREAINPVGVTFNNIKVNSVEANSSAHQITNHIPNGVQAFTNNVKNFYFAKVVSDLSNYPRVNINISPLVRTPLNVDIYCGTPITNYCKDRSILNNTRLTATTREQTGWYLSSNHNTNLDGNVTALTDNPNIVTISPNTTNITFTNGENGTINETFDNCSSPHSVITITTDPVLKFIPSQYTVNCADINPSQWTGIGEGGNILDLKPKSSRSGKMSW